MNKKALLKELLVQFQNSYSDAIIPSSIREGFMTDSESAHDAILCVVEMLGLEDLVTVEHTVEYGILHYRFHFNVEEDLEELRAEQETAPTQIYVYLEDNEIDSVYIQGAAPGQYVVKEVQLMGNEYDEDVNEYEDIVKAHHKMTQADPAYGKATSEYFDWESWGDEHPDLVADSAEESDSGDDW